jgi:hypothetical protein
MTSAHEPGDAGKPGHRGFPGIEPLAGIEGPLTDVAAVARALAGPAPPVLLDVRWRLGGPPGIESYRAGHLPGAVFAEVLFSQRKERQAADAG